MQGRVLEALRWYCRASSLVADTGRVKAVDLPDTQSSEATSRDVCDMLLGAEHRGLRLAIIGRSVALLLLGIWLVVSRSAEVERATAFAALIGLSIGPGLFHYWIIGSRCDCPAWK